MTQETVERLKKRRDELINKQIDLQKQKRIREYDERAEKRKQRVNEVMGRLGYIMGPTYGVR